MLYSIIAIGDELLAGRVVDTNSGAIARLLEPHGFELREVQVIADTPKALQEAMMRALQQVDLVITTGGLGPTRDDSTKQTLCDIFGGELREDAAVLANVERIMLARGLRLNALTRTQAQVPTSARVINNEVGTAPILWFDLPQGKVVVSLPGVPFETEQMMQRCVAAEIAARFPSPDSLQRLTLMTCGMSESDLAELLAPWETSLPPHLHLAYLPQPGVLRLRLDGRHPDAAFLEGEMQHYYKELIAIIPEWHIMATADSTPAEELLRRCRRDGLTIATAESCTGGTVASRLTSIAGASANFRGGVVAYSNDVKINLLGVEPAAIEAHGAVSETVVRQMAEGVRRLTGADLGVGISGIAGPGGAVEGKPVGTVWIAAASPAATRATCYHFPGSRDRVIDRAATMALLELLTFVPR